MASSLPHLLVCTTASLALLATQVEARDDANVVLLSATPSIVVGTVLLYSMMHNIQIRTVLTVDNAHLFIFVRGMRDCACRLSTHAVLTYPPTPLSLGGGGGDEWTLSHVLTPTKICMHAIPSFCIFAPADSHFSYWLTLTLSLSLTLSLTLTLTLTPTLP